MRRSGWLSITKATFTLDNQRSKPGIKPGFVLLVAPSGSYRIAPYLQAAHSLGLQMLMVSDSENSLVSEVANGITVNFSNIDESIELILVATAKQNILCVLATDDSCIEIASRVAEHYGLPHNKPQAATLTHRKDLARQTLRASKCRIPEFQVIELNRLVDADSLSIEFPVVVKPLALSASRGVIRANNSEEFVQACQRIDHILAKAGQTGFVRNHLLVESYLDGPEFAVEGFIIDSEFHLLTIFDKPEPLTGPYFEETYYLTPSRLSGSRQSDLIDEIRKCCAAYGLEQGPVHAEARLTNSGFVLLELAARTIGGQCGQLIEFSLQQKLEELVIQGMCGIEPKLLDKAQAAGVLMIPVSSSGILKRVEGLTQALKVEFVEDIEIHIREGYELIPLPEGASYLGFIFAKAPGYDEVYRALKEAHQCLKFVTQPVWTLSPLA